MITRPLHQAAPLAKKIREWGATAVLFPTLDILPPLDTNRLETAGQQLRHYQIIIFVSANAVHYALPLWPKSLPKLTVLAMGPGTAKALQEYGITADETPICPHNSEGMLELPILQQHISQKNIAIFCGENTRSTLKTTLTARGAHIDEIICYRRQCPRVDAHKALQQFKTAGINLIISTSSESLTNLCRLFGDIDQEWLQNTPLLVISPAMREQAQQAGFKSILLADGASDAAILLRLKEKQ